MICGKNLPLADFLLEECEQNTQNQSDDRTEEFSGQPIDQRIDTRYRLSQIPGVVRYP